MIIKMDLVKKSGQMEHVLPVSTLMDLKKEKASSSGMMEVVTREIFKKVRYTVLEHTYGKIVNTQGNGKTIKCMEKAYSAGQAAKNIEETTLKARKKDSESFIGLMASLTKDSGRKINSMVKDILQDETESVAKGYGKRASALNGLINKFCVKICLSRLYKRLQFPSPYSVLNSFKMLKNIIFKWEPFVLVKNNMMMLLTSPSRLKHLFKLRKI